MRDDFDFDSGCNHPDFTEYTNGANYFRSVGLPDNLGASYKKRKIDVPVNNLRAVKSRLRRISLHYKKWQLKRLIDLNSKNYLNNFKKVNKFKLNQNDVLGNSREAKYIDRGILEGFRANRLKRRIYKAEMEMEKASRRLDGWLYHNYVVFNTLLGVKPEEVYEDEYYDAHKKDKQQYLGKKYLVKIKKLLLMIDNMNLSLDSEKYSEVYLVYNEILRRLDNKSASYLEMCALEEVYNKLQEIYKEGVEQTNNVGGRFI